MILNALRGLARPRPERMNGARLSRRALLLSGAFAPLLSASGRAQPWVDVKDDSGAAIENLRVPTELDPFGLPGVLWIGPNAPDVTLFEFADYNCPVCKQASIHLDALVRSVPGLRLGLVQNPILSAQSREAARIAMLSLRLAGPAQAYALHQRLFAMRGVVDGARATNAARELGVDTSMAGANMVKQADDALAAQERLANAIGFSVTPSYVLNGIGVFGHPGPKSLTQMVEAVKACDALVCS